jgi:hypothetical protein
MPHFTRPLLVGFDIVLMVFAPLVMPVSRLPNLEFPIATSSLHETKVNPLYRINLPSLWPQMGEHRAEETIS